MTKRAETTHIEPGQHSIGRANMRERDGQFVMDWRVRLHDGRLVRARTVGASKGELRARARRKAAEMLASSSTGSWRPGSNLNDYIAQVSLPAIRAARLRDNSRTRYLVALSQLTGSCTSHKHVASLKGHTIGTGTRFRALEACLKEVAQLHGTESARQCRTVLTKYVIDQLLRDELLEASPIAGRHVDLTSAKAVTPRGGQALTRDEYQRVMAYLLALDPADGLVKPRRGRWSLADAVAKRANAIDLTLLQMASGLRVTEGNTLEWHEVTVRADGTLTVTVPVEKSKTKKARTVPLLDPRVADRITARRVTSTGTYVIGSPADQSIPWDRANAQKATTPLYQELATVCDVPVLTTARTHVWRATLNTLLIDVPVIIRAAYFGHDKNTNEGAYTDTTDTGAMYGAARELLAELPSRLPSSEGN